ncbi:M15 family metallopeptidase [Sporolactobacillus putidus]|uniref:D-alanyl-D-alanine carboxypeptidase n=1 Tax=Sporolactobacillus putidus TaxID=492735 RepID=A0A917S8K3_9BACL|nr:M15 family metallopeptidase [Sporolactobacillus putidus]GGL64446.1 D-alanyl-D-alanine carboxypeptidase [Sporolactobacillus putidus]
MKVNINLYAGVIAAFLSLAACSDTVHQVKPSNVQKDSPAAQPGLAVKTVSSLNREDVHIVANPDSTLVLVNKFFKLPDNYVPKQLVYPDVPFITGDKSETAKMRPAAAKALETMFAAAQKDGIQLAGVSAYRSYASQTVLFNTYVKEDGEKKALTYSARPGTSEHETGLAIDVSGISGQYAASPAFATTPEAAWLAAHAPDYGFIIRYPKGKESVTGYEYEAWHLRYVGLPVSKKIAERGLTLEEYLSDVSVIR